MRISTYAYIALLFYPSLVFGDWTCMEVASIKNGNIILSCGVGSAKTESEARERALRNAKKEFHFLCEDSSDCRGFETN